MHITFNILAEYELLFNLDICIEKIERMFAWSSTNALINKFCSWKNYITNKKLSSKENFKHSAKFSKGKIFLFVLFEF